ncbi:hypothetical protein N9B57_03350 [Verrucomicrobia bacterium]|jgi:hypothetical protein|nr:hypothetical protein [Verrucomicrobiota bacterium]MDA7866953.1 hypothetical protein [Verrucomicrobiota bacterium]
MTKSQEVMKCEFCKEEIFSDAVVCRFCNAELVDGEWTRVRPKQEGASRENRKGIFTIRTAAVFFFLSAILELISMASEVSIAGRLFGGLIASLYHLFYGTLFIGMGAGLWIGRKWGLKVMFLGTIVYTIEKAGYLLNKEAQLLEIERVSSQFGDLVDLVGIETILQMTNLTFLLILGCWWGFMGYLYVRRAYFGYRGQPEGNQ